MREDIIKYKKELDKESSIVHIDFDGEGENRHAISVGPERLQNDILRIYSQYNFGELEGRLKNIMETKIREAIQNACIYQIPYDDVVVELYCEFLARTKSLNEKGEIEVSKLTPDVLLPKLVYLYPEVHLIRRKQRVNDNRLQSDIYCGEVVNYDLFAGLMESEGYTINSRNYLDALYKRIVGEEITIPLELEEEKNKEYNKHKED